MTYDLVIIGGGPAGVAAGVYAARKKIKTALIAESFGGQSAVSSEIQNWIGTKAISGFDLAKSLEEHLRAQDGGIDIISGDLVTAVAPIAGGFSLTTKNGKTLDAKYVLAASGSRHKKLDIPGEKEFDGKGVVYCSTCDAPLLGRRPWRSWAAAIPRLNRCSTFPVRRKNRMLMVRSDVSKRGPVTQDKVKGHPNVEFFRWLKDEVVGKDLVTGLKYHDAKTNEKKELAVEGVFVEIGLAPNADFLSNVVTLNSRGEIVTDPRTQETSCDGIWAAGNVTDAPIGRTTFRLVMQ